MHPGASSLPAAGPARRASLPVLPSELLSGIAAHLDGNEVLALGQTTKTIYSEIPGELDSARLTAHAARAPNIDTLAAVLGRDTAPVPPTRLHPRGRPNVIAALREDLQDAPYSAAALNLAQQARACILGDVATRIQQYGIVRVQMRAIPVAHWPPVLEALAPKIAGLPGSVGTEAYDQLFEAILEQPSHRQAVALKGLTSSVVKQADLQRFERFVGALAHRDSSQRADLLQKLLPAIRKLPDDDKLRACHTMLDAMETLATDSAEAHLQMTNLCHGMCHYVMAEASLPEREALLGALARQMARVPDYPLETTVAQLPRSDRAVVREALREAVRETIESSR